MISELMNKQFLVIDETDIANIKHQQENNNISSSPTSKQQQHQKSNSLQIPSSPPSLTPLSTSPSGSSSMGTSPNSSSMKFHRRRGSSSLSKGQLEIRKVYEKISNSAIFNVKDKLIEKNQKAIQLSNDESLLA